MRRPAVRDRLTVARDRIVEAEPRAAELADPRVDPELVVEVRRLAVADVRLQHERLDPLRAQGAVPAGELREVRDARDLEPDEVRGVVRDALRVGFGEAHADVGVEAKRVHPVTLSGTAVLALALFQGSDPGGV